ncbi:hypothetical protein PENSPDRAFT_612371 [Peniophora sp. CONT]|nr:hypothetical protein PENSPDRAFT_612371 [Peniophora sp. CONT]
MSSADVNVPFFKKKRARPTTQRQRSVEPPAASEAPASSSSSAVVLPTRKVGSGALTGSKRTSSQRQEDDDEERRDGPSVNWGASGSSHQEAAREILAGDEAEEILAKRRRADNPEDPTDVPDDGLYRGQKAYKSHLEKNKDTPKAMRAGPQRSTGSTIKTVTVIDYQPDVCKDYKETGFCGFGDTCKFLHDRGTYLAGWQLDKLAANSSGKRNAAAEESSDSDSDEEDIPFACLICRKPYADPIVTKCGHYFCSACAIKRFGRTPKCAACGAPTGGMFNRATTVLEKIRKMKEKAEGKNSDGEGEDGSGGVGGVQIEGLVNGDGSGSGSDDEE